MTSYPKLNTHARHGYVPLAYWHLSNPSHAADGVALSGNHSAACSFHGYINPISHFSFGWSFVNIPHLSSKQTDFASSIHSSSACIKGFAISSLPSTGEMRTRSVPRATIKPRGREDSLPSSSASSQRCANPTRHECGEYRECRSPRMTSLTSSSTRFMSWSYPFSVPTTGT